MRVSKSWAVVLTVILAMLLMAVNAGSTLAAPAAVTGEEETEAVEIEFTGTVKTVDEEAGTLVVSVEQKDETVVDYVVYLPEDFDWTTVKEGEVVEVEGTLEENGDVLATKVKVETEDEDEEDEDQAEEDEDEQEEEGEEALSGGFFCRHLDIAHPIGLRLADQYGVPYEQVMEWFCAGKFGFGQIKHALRTAQVISETERVTDTTEVDLADVAGIFLKQRKAGLGWGRIWKQLSQADSYLEPDEPEGTEDTDQPEETTDETEEEETEVATQSLEKQTGRDRQEAGVQLRGNGKVKTTGQNRQSLRGASSLHNLRLQQADRTTPPGQARGKKTK
jgi:cytochrome c-type biogenesis protein CcmE